MEIIVYFYFFLHFAGYIRWQKKKKQLLTLFTGLPSFCHFMSSSIAPGLVICFFFSFSPFLPSASLDLVLDELHKFTSILFKLCPLLVQV